MMHAAPTTYRTFFCNKHTNKQPTKLKEHCLLWCRGRRPRPLRVSNAKWMWHVGLAPPPSDVLHDYYYYSYYNIIAMCKAVDVYLIFVSSTLGLRSVTWFLISFISHFITMKQEGCWYFDFILLLYTSNLMIKVLSRLHSAVVKRISLQLSICYYFYIWPFSLFIYQHLLTNGISGIVTQNPFLQFRCTRLGDSQQGCAFTKMHPVSSEPSSICFARYDCGFIFSVNLFYWPFRFCSRCTYYYYYYYYYACLFCIRPLRGPSTFCYLFVFYILRLRAVFLHVFVLFMSTSHVFISLFVSMLLLFSFLASRSLYSQYMYMCNKKEHISCSFASL